jgi:rubrerythrin
MFGKLEIDVTLEDPKAYSKPFTVRINQRVIVDEERSSSSATRTSSSAAGSKSINGEVRMIPGVAHRRQFKNLTEQEVLALAISSEEDDARIYRWFAQRLRSEYAASAQVFDEMAREEDSHREWLLDEHRRRFGDTIPLLRREHVAGFFNRRPVWLIENLGLERIRDEAANMEADAASFYHRAAQRTTDAGTRKLLDRLAAAESGHESTWHGLLREHLPPRTRAAEDAEAHRHSCSRGCSPVSRG